jgi:hypothetical protein
MPEEALILKRDPDDVQLAKSETTDRLSRASCNRSRAYRWLARRRHLVRRKHLWTGVPNETITQIVILVEAWCRFKRPYKARAYQQAESYTERD